MCAKRINSKLGICMRTLCLTLSMWKVRLDEIIMTKFVTWSRQRCPPPIPFTGQRVKQITRMLTCKSSPITLSCCLSYFCRVVNHWTPSIACNCTVASEAYHDWSGEAADAQLRVNFTLNYC